MTDHRTAPAQYAIWYFVAATFVFAAPTLFLHSAEPWVRIVTLAAGLVLIVLGGIRFGREIRQRNASRRRDG